MPDNEKRRLQKGDVKRRYRYYKLVSKLAFNVTILRSATYLN
jgi:hypothetical protein